MEQAHRVLASIIIASLVLGGPGAVVASPSGTSNVPTPDVKKDANNVATAPPSAKFDGKIASKSLAKDLASAAGDGDRFLGGGRCDKLDASGNPTSSGYDHCLTLTVGADRNLTTYVLIDTACPDGNAASACYAGYVISTRADVKTSVSTQSHTTTIVTTSKMRLGVKRKPIKKGVKSKVTLPGVDPYVLPTDPALTLTLTQTSKGTTGTQALDIVDSAGNSVVSWSAGWAADSGSTSCTDVGALTEAREANAWNLGAGVLLVVGEVGVAAAALSVATGATVGTLGLGVEVAVPAGAAIFTGGSAFVVGASLALREYGKSSAHLDGLEATQACITQQRIDQFKPQDLDDIDDGMDDWDDASDNPAVTNAACGGHTEGTFTDDSGATCTYSCDESVVDGDCRNACVDIC